MTSSFTLVDRQFSGEGAPLPLGEGYGEGGSLVLTFTVVPQ